MLFLIDDNNNLAELRWHDDQKGSVLAGQDEAKACFSCCLCGWTAERHQDHVTAERLRGDSLQGVTSVNFTGKSSSHIQQLLSPDGLQLNSCLRASVAAGLTVGLMANGEVPPVDGDPRLEGGRKTGVNQQRIGVDLRAKSDAFSFGVFFLRSHLVGGTLVVMRAKKRS